MTQPLTRPMMREILPGRFGCRRRWLAAVVACLSLTTATSTVRAGEEPPEIVGVRVGIAGYYRVGLWTQVEVTLRGGSQSVAGRVSVTVPDGDNVPSRVTTPAETPCRLEPGKESVVRLSARFGRVQSEMTVALHVDDQTVVQHRFQAGHSPQGSTFRPALPAGRELFVVVGTGPVGMKQAIALQYPDESRQPAVARIDDFSRLPVASIGYEGVDVLVLSTSEPKIYAPVKPDSPRVEAIDRWIASGGKLIFSVGSSCSTVLAEGAPLARFAPGRFDPNLTDRLRQTRDLEMYCASKIPIPRLAGDQIPRVPGLAEIDGVNETPKAAVPLVVRSVRGFGEIVFLAADLDQPPLRDWTDRGRLVAKLLGGSAEQEQPRQRQVMVSEFGFDDMAGQLRSALDRYPGVTAVPFWAVVALIVVYILCIGPGDYFLLRKFGRRMCLTWVTFPLTVLLFGAGAYVLAHRTKDDRIHVSRADLIDVDVAGGRVRQTTWAGVFSPETATYDFSLRPGLADGAGIRQTEIRMAWLGLPGGALGGMNPKTTEPATWNLPYDFTPHLDAMENVPIPVWSSKSLVAQWTAATDMTLRCDLTDKDGRPVGRITNTLDFALEDCWLVYQHRAIELGTVAPGQVVQLERFADRLRLKTLLTGATLVLDESKKPMQEDAYLPSSVDIKDILRKMSFFEAAGGRAYTGLDNRYQHFVDLTRLQEVNRAVLVADGPPARKHTQLLDHGTPIGTEDDYHTTQYRFLLPVKGSSD